MPTKFVSKPSFHKESNICRHKWPLLNKKIQFFLNTKYPILNFLTFIDRELQKSYIICNNITVECIIVNLNVTKISPSKYNCMRLWTCDFPLHGNTQKSLVKVDFNFSFLLRKSHISFFFFFIYKGWICVHVTSV